MTDIPGKQPPIDLGEPDQSGQVAESGAGDQSTGQGTKDVLSVPSDHPDRADAHMSPSGGTTNTSFRADVDDEPGSSLRSSTPGPTHDLPDPESAKTFEQPALPREAPRPHIFTRRTTWVFLGIGLLTLFIAGSSFFRSDDEGTSQAVIEAPSPSVTVTELPPVQSVAAETSLPSAPSATIVGQAGNRAEITSAVRVAGSDAPWSATLDVTRATSPQLLVEMRLKVHTSGESPIGDLAIGTYLPPGFTYERGTTLVYDMATPSGRSLGDNISTGGITLSPTYVADSTVYVVATFQLDRTSLRCGSNVLAPAYAARFSGATEAIAAVAIRAEAEGGQC